MPEETRRFVAFTDSRRLFLSTSCPKSVTFVAASPGLVGRGTALKMLLGGEDFDGKLAERYGYVNQPCPVTKTAMATILYGLLRGERNGEKAA